MKLLQNRLVVGIMAAAAVALLGWRLWPLVHRPSRSRPQQPVASATTPASAATQAVSRPPASETNSGAARTSAPPTLQPNGFEVSSVKANAPRWTETPQRDPFQAHGVRSTKQGSNAPAMQLLKLGAIMRQTGSMLAVINNKVVSESDTMLGFKIETIGAEHVWVNGPNGREEIVFLQPVDPNFEYRVVDGVTNNVTTDPGWRLLSGTNREKLGDRSYRVALSNNLTVVIRNIPFNLIDGQELLPIRCKYVGTETYEARSGDKKAETVSAYDYGVPCDPPKASVDRRDLQNALLLEQYAEVSGRRARSDIDDAGKGNASSQYILGRRYLDGEGVSKDENEGRRWLEKSAAQGNVDAQAVLEKLGSPK